MKSKYYDSTEKSLWSCHNCCTCKRPYPQPSWWIHRWLNPTDGAEALNDIVESSFNSLYDYSSYSKCDYYPVTIHSFVLVCSWLFYHEINRFYHFSSLIYNQTHVLIMPLLSFAGLLRCVGHGVSISPLPFSSPGRRCSICAGKPSSKL